MSTEFELQELNELLQDMQDIDDVFAEASLEELEALEADGDASDVFSVLSDEELSAAGLGDLVTSEAQSFNLDTLVTDEVEAAFLKRWIKDKLRKRAKKSIAALVRYLKRNRKCVKCLKQVQSAIFAYSKGSYGTALYRSAKATACIVRCVRK